MSASNTTSRGILSSTNIRKMCLIFGLLCGVALCVFVFDELPARCARRLPSSKKEETIRRLAFSDAELADGHKNVIGRMYKGPAKRRHDAARSDIMRRLKGPASGQERSRAARSKENNRPVRRLPRRTTNLKRSPPISKEITTALKWSVHDPRPRKTKKYNRPDKTVIPERHIKPSTDRVATTLSLAERKRNFANYIAKQRKEEAAGKDQNMFTQNDIAAGKAALRKKKEMKQAKAARKKEEKRLRKKARKKEKKRRKNGLPRKTAGRVKKTENDPIPIVGDFSAATPDIPDEKEYENNDESEKAQDPKKLQLVNRCARTSQHLSLNNDFTGVMEVRLPEESGEVSDNEP